ncbi:MAG: hypothetical protein QOF06_139 [Solirubrobacterales bacterium]|jgi:hypothetical protein|nr:hypothetical protein [Solirubrobacterales bacterium]
MSSIAVKNLRRCKKCQSLYDNNSSSNKGFCPADGQSHERSNFDYQLTFGISERNAQSNWRRCTRCQAIFFNGYQQGRCPADPDAREPHRADPARDFRIPYGRPESEHVRAGWEFCTKCDALFYAHSQAPEENHCTAGGEHQAHPDAYRFALTHGRPLPVLIDEGTELNPVDE